VYANRLGERIVPAPDAKVIDPRKADADRRPQQPAPDQPTGRAA
jgi:hypothetical protein